MKKLKVAFIGSGGRVGNEFERIVNTEGGFELTLGVGRNASATFLATAKKCDDKIKNCDLIIDFSAPELFSEALAAAVTFQKPFVSGTTGLSEKQKKALQVAAKKIPVLWASNMSLGVATLKKSLEPLIHLKEFDFFIEEFHHNKKKDNPSGTAITLQEKLKEIGIKPVAEPVGFRGGGIFGIHKIHAVSNEEHLVFEHQALNRGVFARGAMVAAKWLYKKKPGFYKVEDIFNG